MYIAKKETPEDTFYSFFFMCISIARNTFPLYGLYTNTFACL